MPSLLEPGRENSRETTPSEPSNQPKKIKLNLPQSSRSKFYEDKPRIDTADMDLEKITQVEDTNPEVIHSEGDKEARCRSIKSKEADKANLTCKLKDKR